MQFRHFFKANADFCEGTPMASLRVVLEWTYPLSALSSVRCDESHFSDALSIDRPKAHSPP